MKKYFITYLLSLISIAGFCQDSTDIPKIDYKNGSYKIMVIHSLTYVPACFTAALDSINGSPLKIYENGMRTGIMDIPDKDKREFRLLRTGKKIWLMTYAHWEGKRHIHFFIFTMAGNQVHKITAGISDFDIDTIETIERLKYTNEVTFINLASETNLHKF